MFSGGAGGLALAVVDGCVDGVAGGAGEGVAPAGCEPVAAVVLGGLRVVVVCAAEGLVLGRGFVVVLVLGAGPGAGSAGTGLAGSGSVTVGGAGAGSAGVAIVGAVAAGCGTGGFFFLQPARTAIRAMSASSVSLRSGIIGRSIATYELRG